MAQTTTDCTKAAEYLADARAALHALNLGRKTVRITTGDKTLEYSVTDKLGLIRYINDLQDQVDACNGTARACRGAFRIMPI